MYLTHKQIRKQSGAVGACWAHNPEVDGSKPSSANIFFFPIFNYYSLVYPSCSIGMTPFNQSFESDWFINNWHDINEQQYTTLRKSMMYLTHKQIRKQSGAVGACWAHNPEVDGSKPSSANIFFFPIFNYYSLVSPSCSIGMTQFNYI